MSAISLESAIRTCKVDTGYANKVESQRFLDRNTMICPIWSGVDTAGRSVSRDSFVTKTAGCNSAEDRVVVENSQRPQYMEYINLSANGIDGSIYGDRGGSEEMYGDTMPWNLVGDNNNNFNYPLNKQACLNKWSPECANNVNNVTGQFGNQLSSSVYPACGYYPYQQAMSQEQEALRKQAALNNAYTGNSYRHASGFGEPTHKPMHSTGTHKMVAPSMHQMQGMKPMHHTTMPPMHQMQGMKPMQGMKNMQGMHHM